MSIRLLELFGGIGSCTQAFKRLNIPHEVVDYVEIDKYAVKSYNAMNGTNFEPQDISKWDKDIEVDFIMHGSPCQDFSVAGQGKGASEGGETRSSLMYETVRIVSKLKPQYVLWENVKNVLSKKHKHNFDNYLAKMEEQGYTNYYQVLNAKDYNIPQNRERVFVLSILNDTGFEFPPKIERTRNLSDMLEEVVDEKFYISNEKAEKLISQLKVSGKQTIHTNYNKVDKEETDVAKTLCARDYKGFGTGFDTMNAVVEPVLFGGEQRNQAVKTDGVSTCLTSCMDTGGRYVPMVSEVGYLPWGESDKKHQSNTVYSSDGLSPTLSATDYKNPPKFTVHPCLTPDRLEKRQNGRRCKEDGEPMFTLTGQDRHGVVLMYNPYNDRIIDKTAPCVTTMVDRLNASSTVLIFENIGYLISIRKLTPKECWRLMGFSDDVFHLAEQVNSNSQLYKQAGNSIVVDVLVGIIEQIHIVKSRWLDEILGI